MISTIWKKFYQGLDWADGMLYHKTYKPSKHSAVMQKAGVRPAFPRLSNRRQFSEYGSGGLPIDKAWRVSHEPYSSGVLSNRLTEVEWYA